MNQTYTSVVFVFDVLEQVGKSYMCTSCESWPTDSYERWAITKTVLNDNQMPYQCIQENTTSKQSLHWVLSLTVMFNVWCNICGQTIMLCVCSCEVDIAVNGVYPMEERPSTAQKHFDARSSPVKNVRIGEDDDE